MAAKTNSSRSSSTADPESTGTSSEGAAEVSAAKPAAAKRKRAPSKKKAAPKEPENNAIKVASSVSAAAKRIQEREARRKQRTAERLSSEKPARTANGHRATPAKKQKSMSARDLAKFKALLLELRDRIVGDIQFLTTDNLHRMGRETGADLSGASQHSADHGTDNFDREFALSLATSEQDVLYEIDDALQRIEDGTFGFCEMTGVAIEKARLEVIPYTRFSVQAQARMEQGRAKYRPFAQAFKSW